jgi:telomere length regulation protein
MNSHDAATVQTTLLAVAYLDRLNHNLVKNTSRSSSYIHAVSNRLGSSIPSARYLGMIVGVAISRLVDEPGKVMDFGAEEMDSEEGKAWLGLVDINDKIGKIEDLHKDKGTIQSATKPAAPSRKTKTTPPQPPASKIISITELLSSDSSDPPSPSLRPYPKPDSDPSDSDSDPTLLIRSKPTAPVYINSLITAISSTDPSTVSLALHTAAPLIRRKATFGSELSSSLDTLASTLLNLSENMSKSLPQNQRLQALIALVIAEPARTGPWLSAMYFEGDLSLVQRATLLTAIGLGCRELAGFTDTDANTDTNTNTANTTPIFPSKKLPPTLSAIYTPLTNISNSLSHSTLQPLAHAAAASTISGPVATATILQTRTISSRLTKARSTPQPTATRSTPIPKNLHHLLTTSFFLPLLTRLSHLITNPHSRNSTLLTPHPLSLTLQTLLLLLHTLGPNAVSLPLTTRETLSLLLLLHNHPISLDPTVLPPLLSLLLCLLDLNTQSPTAEERLVSDFGAQISELISWISGLQNQSSHNIPTLDGTGTGTGNNNSDRKTTPWPAIAAGCQVKWQEVGRKFQGRMLGLRGGELDGF